MRTVLICLLVLCLPGCTYLAEEPLDELNTLTTTYLLTIEQCSLSDEGSAPSPTPEPDGEACMSMADPNYPCPCQGDIQACKHSPRCVPRAEPPTTSADQLEAEAAALKNEVAQLKAESTTLNEELGKLREAIKIPPLDVTKMLKELIPESKDPPKAKPTVEDWLDTLPPTCIVYVGRKNCPPCRTQESVVLAGLVRAHWPSVYVDADFGPVAKWLDVKSTPTIIGFVDGVEVGRLVGLSNPIEAAANTVHEWFLP